MVGDESLPICARPSCYYRSCVGITIILLAMDIAFIHDYTVCTVGVIKAIIEHSLKSCRSHIKFLCMPCKIMKNSCKS